VVLVGNEQLDTGLLRNLVARIREGDADAETEMVRQFSQRIFVMSFVRTHDREMARELVQDVLMSIIGSLRKGQLEDVDKLPAFVHGTARNLINNRLRLENQRPRLEPLPDDFSQAHMMEQIEEGERLRLVHQALEDLADSDRQILWMTLVEGRKPGEIASTMGLTAEVVRTRKVRATKKVAEAVQKKLSRSQAISHIVRKEGE
jgi:RNA polymerase sigma-70 factor (ECF subfamily)